MGRVHRQHPIRRVRQLIRDILDESICSTSTGTAPPGTAPCAPWRGRSVPPQRTLLLWTPMAPCDCSPRSWLTPHGYPGRPVAGGTTCSIGSRATNPSTMPRNGYASHGLRRAVRRVRSARSALRSPSARASLRACGKGPHHGDPRTRHRPPAQFRPLNGQRCPLLPRLSKFPDEKLESTEEIPVTVGNFPTVTEARRTRNVAAIGTGYSGKTLDKADRNSEHLFHRSAYPGNLFSSGTSFFEVLPPLRPHL